MCVYVPQTLSMPVPIFLATQMEPEAMPPARTLLEAQTAHWGAHAIAQLAMQSMPTTLQAV